MDNFIGNVYIFIPCYVADKARHLRFLKHSEKAKNSDCAFLDLMERRSEGEIVWKVTQNTTRRYLGRYDFACFDPEEERLHGHFTYSGSVYETSHDSSGLSIVVVCLEGFVGPITELLDRVSGEALEIYLGGDERGQSNFHAFKEELKTSFGLAKAGVTRVCISTFEMPDAEIIPYCFANETYLASDMNSKVIAPTYVRQARENLAEYSSAEIFAGARTVLRLDRDSRSEDCKAPNPWADSKLLFLIEVLMMKEAAISRSNKHVIETIESGSRVTLDVIESLSKQFGKTMPFWNIDSFKYITAQNLADKLDRRFGLDDKLHKYFDNQRFLEHRINVRYAQQERSEDVILYIIAILLFIFQGTPFLYRIILSLYMGVELEHPDLLAISGSVGITLSLIAMLLIILKRKRRIKNLDN